MKTWRLATKLEVCGNCIAFIDRGTPLLLIELPGVVSKKVRCARCAGEPPPADISVDVEVEVHEPVRWQIASLPFDYKTKQAGK